jgi:hypothetical protein
MKKFLSVFFFLLGLFFFTQLFSQSINVTPKCKLGVVLYTFHRFSFPEQLAKADSAGVKFVEGFMFSKTGPALKDSMITMLSSAGIEKFNQLINAKRLQMVSVYLMGGT